jgi:hypothetical protein
MKRIKKAFWHWLFNVNRSKKKHTDWMLVDGIYHPTLSSETYRSIYLDLFY